MSPEKTPVEKWTGGGHGWDEAEKGLDAEDERPRTGKGLRRYSVKQGERGSFVFLDDAPYVIREHSYYKDGNWYNFFTCISHLDTCPACEADMYASLTGFFTVVDTTGFTGRDGKVFKNWKQIMAVKKDQLQIFRERAKDRGGLLGWGVKTFRAKGKTTPAIGSDFDFVRKIENLSTFFADELESGVWSNGLDPYNYEEIFRELLREQVQRLVDLYGKETKDARKKDDRGGSGDDSKPSEGTIGEQPGPASTAGKKDDEIPF